MVGKQGWCDTNYPSEALWKNVNYEYVGEVFLTWLCRAGGCPKNRYYTNSRVHCYGYIIQFNDALIVASASYKRQLEKLKRIIIEKKKRKLGDFSEEEKKIFENIDALAGILIKMCDIKLVFKDEVTDCELVNVYAVEKNVQEARNFLSSNNLYI